MSNADVAKVLVDLADLMEIQGANPFRVRAHRNGARTVETLAEPIAALAAAHAEGAAAGGQRIRHDVSRRNESGRRRKSKNLKRRRNRHYVRKRRKNLKREKKKKYARKRRKNLE